MDNLTFVIYKQTKWTIESTNGSKVERREHTSRRQGIISLFQRHPSLLFHLIVPATDKTGNQDFFFRKSTLSNKWRFNGKEYDSRIKAVNGFLHAHPRLPMFYIIIPIEQSAK